MWTIGLQDDNRNKLWGRILAESRGGAMKILHIKFRLFYFNFSGMVATLYSSNVYINLLVSYLSESVTPPTQEICCQVILATHNWVYTTCFFLNRFSTLNYDSVKKGTAFLAGMYIVLPCQSLRLSWEMMAFQPFQLNLEIMLLAINIMRCHIQRMWCEQLSATSTTDFSSKSVKLAKLQSVLCWLINKL